MLGDKNFYWSAFWETLVILVLTILPTVFIFFSIVFDQESTKTFSDFYKSGEFFLYSVSFSSSGLLVYRSIRKGISYFALVIIILSSVAYMVTLNAKKPNLEIITQCSIFSFFISLIIFYCAQVVSNRNANPPDPRDFRQTEQNTIEQGLN